MTSSSYTCKSSSGVNLSIDYYEAVNPKGLVQILHGMQEHKERYKDFALFLNSNGYSVVIHDHLGHGKSTDDRYKIGDMASLENVVKDIEIVRKTADFNGKYMLFGHSMGSFLARIYASKYPLDGLILSGTGQTPNFAANLIKFLLKFYKNDNQLFFINKLIVFPLAHKLKNPSDWLSYNIENQKKYKEDQLCGFPFRKRGYETLMDMVKVLNEQKTYRECKAKKILLISGKDDPVGDFTKGVKKVNENYRKYKKDVETIFYEKMTHEILNEKNNEIVYRDILKFIDRL